MVSIDWVRGLVNYILERPEARLQIPQKGLSSADKLKYGLRDSVMKQDKLKVILNKTK